VGVAAAVERSARVVDVHALERGGEAVRVALATHLAVGDDVEPGALLVGDGEPGGIVLRLLEIGGIDPPQLPRADPRREPAPQLLAVDEPVRLGVRADEAGEDPGGLGHRGPSFPQSGARAPGSTGSTRPLKPVLAAGAFVWISGGV